MTKKTIATLSLALLWTGAALAQQQQTPPSFLNVVAVGDSLTLGVKSGSVNSQDQIEAYPALIARQVRTFFFLPLLFGPEIKLVQPGLPPVVEVIPNKEVGRVFQLIVPQNLAVGGHNVADALTTRPDLPFDSLIDLILGVPLLQLGIQVSQIELAVGTQPTFTIFWLGANDVLGAATQGDPALVTPFPAFQAAYTQAVGALLTMTPTQIVAANVPDVTAIAFLVPAQQVAAIAGAPLAVIGPVLGIQDGDFVTLTGAGLAQAILTGQQTGPLPANVVLTAAEVATIQAAVTQMNAFIAGLGQQLGFPVVDINAFLLDAKANGIDVGNLHLTTDFLGGIFSLDGVHPTATAQGLVANRFIDKINEFYGTAIPPVDVATIAATDDLVLKSPAAKSSLQSKSVRELKGSGTSLLEYNFEAFERAKEMIHPAATHPAVKSRDNQGGGRR